MDRSLGQVVGGVMAALPGWVMVLCGAATVSATLLMPQWLQSQSLRWQLAVMQRQVDQISAQAEDYQKLVAAVREGDRDLLARLAFLHLRWKPEGAELLTPATPLSPVGVALPPDDEAGWWLRVQPTVTGALSTEPLPLERMLDRELPVPGWNCAPPPVTATTLMRLTVGSRRHLVGAFGLLLVCLGLMMTPPRTSEPGA